MFNPRSTRSPTPAGLPLGYFCMNVQSALHAEPDSKNSQSLVCLYSFITAYLQDFASHPTHTKRL